MLKKYILVLLYLLLLGVGIPWYQSPQDESTLFGFPTWVCIAIDVSFGFSILTAIVLNSPWDEEDIEEENDDE